MHNFTLFAADGEVNNYNKGNYIRERNEVEGKTSTVTGLLLGVS